MGGSPQRSYDLLRRRQVARLFCGEHFPPVHYDVEGSGSAPLDAGIGSQCASQFLAQFARPGADLPSKEAAPDLDPHARASSSRAIFSASPARRSNQSL